ncbi:MAG: DUF4810 domain-containing protein [Gammaproteobacteria bacterium]|nr:DUF4810 domain-containing protein [Gammaproteobacteria bacterium]
MVPTPISAGVFAALLLLVAGCAQKKPQIYRWGIYQDLVYQQYLQPGMADPATQAAKLSEDIQRTEAEGKRIPPGVHAHLGYVYYSLGNTGLAMEQFDAERTLFPESSVFIDGILGRLEGKE